MTGFQIITLFQSNGFKDRFIIWTPVWTKTLYLKVITPFDPINMSKVSQERVFISTNICLRNK